MSAHRLLLTRHHDAFNARRFDEYAELLDENVVSVIERRSTRGRTAVCDCAAAVVREIPGAHMELERVIAESGDQLIAQTRLVDAAGKAGGPAVFGEWRLPITVYEVYRIAGGQIVERRAYIDTGLTDDPSAGGAAGWSVLARLMAEQAALRRVATLVARGADQAEVFDAIVTEAAALFGEDAWLLRFGDVDAVTVVALHGTKDDGKLRGVTVSGDEAQLERLRSGQPVRVENYAGPPGTDAELARRLGVVASAAAPLVVQGFAWGALAVNSRVGLAPGIEHRLAQFSELAAVAVANAQSRAELELLADEQTALRRVAELVARGAATQEVFDQVTVQASRLLDDMHTELLRYERSGTEVVNLAQSCSEAIQGSDNRFRLGARLPVVGDIGRARVWRTGRAARIDDYRGVAGAEVVSAAIGASVLAPVVVEGRLWGVLSATSPGPPLPVGTEERLTRFCELVAAAIANAESRAELTASRARIVASGDEARRRLARDVHDGAQQRQVHAIITLKQAQAALQGSDGPAAGLVDESLVQAQAANALLRELAHGIMPAALARGGLRAGIDALRAHVPLTVAADVVAERLPEPVETTAYFAISEALTNIVKHAGADRARVRAVLADDRLEIQVSDDGRGGADRAGGSGLVGLADRVDAAGGSMSLNSPPGAGTTLFIALPIDRGQMSDRPDA